ncbi:MAG: ATP-binding protein [Rickettsiales bacterium]
METDPIPNGVFPSILVCIDSHPKSPALLRAAAARANEVGQPGKWTALYVETKEHATLDKESRDRLRAYLSAAERMGAETLRIRHASLPQCLVELVAEREGGKRPFAQVIIGQTRQDGFLSDFRPSLAEKIAKKLRKCRKNVQILQLQGKRENATWGERAKNLDFSFRNMGFAVLSVLCACALSEILRAGMSAMEWRVNVHNVTAFFLIACIITALRFGLGPGLVSALLGFSAINYFYVAPLRGFNLDHSADSINLAVFLLAAVSLSFMGAYSRSNHKNLTRKERKAEAFYKIYRLTGAASDRNEALSVLHRELKQLLDVESVFFLPSALNPDVLEPAYPKESRLNETEYELMESAWKKETPHGMGTLHRPDCAWRFEPLISASGVLGVLGVKTKENFLPDMASVRLFSGLADQIANILERIELTKMMGESRMREEREKLRVMLLSSVSHDLKTPLASIIGSLSVYKRMRKSGRLTTETEEELTDTALEEAQRLDSFISNILDMTRIESGHIEFDLEWNDPAAPVEAVKRRLRTRLQRRELRVIPSKNAWEVKMDAMMTEQVLQNLIDNAVKYSPEGSEIDVSYGVDHDNEHFYYRVRDRGNGIPEDKFEAVFDKYERLRQSDSKVAGTGLGLAICRAVMHKQGGDAVVRNHPEGGAIFTVFFPSYRPKSDLPDIDDPEIRETT